MALSREAALSYLQRAHDQNRLAHAYLISGPSGSGKRALASDLANLGGVSTLVSVAAWVLTFGSMLAAFPPSVITGAMFALAAVCTGLSAVWMAWCAAAVAIAAIILIGTVYVPGESSAVLLPNLQGAEQVFRAFLALNVLASLPTTLCWWLAKPLRRARIAA